MLTWKIRAAAFAVALAVLPIAACNNATNTDATYTRGSMPGRSRFPGIDQDYAHRAEVADISGDDGHSMDERGGSDERIAVRARVGYLEGRASLRNRGVNRQNAAGECGYDVPVHPGTKHGALLAVATFQKKNSYLQFQD